MINTLSPCAVNSNVLLEQFYSEKEEISLMFKLRSLVLYGFKCAPNNRICGSYVFPLQGKNLLYSDSSLGMDSFKEARQNELKILENKEEFINEMQEVLNDADCIIGLSDIKKMTRIAETQDDINLLIPLAKRLMSQKNVRITSFNIGSEVMRCLYLLNKPVEAFNLVKDDRNAEFFCDVRSFVLVMTLLFKNNMFEEVIETFYTVKDKQFGNKKYPGSLINLFYGSCCKLNTPESYKKAECLWQEFTKFNFKLPLSSLFFFSFLALKQNHIQVVFDLLDLKRGFTQAVNILVIALAKAKRYNDLFSLFQDKFFTNRNVKDMFITADTFEYVEKLTEASSNEEYSKHLKHIKDSLIENNYLSEMGLEELLFAEVDLNQKKKQR